jgi:hypothetical protein
MPDLISPAEARARLGNAAVPGLYAWWADAAGAVDLSRGAGLVIEPGRIYAGQAGAASSQSGKASRATLKSRLLSLHLGGNLGASTFRLTLASLLVDRLGLAPDSREFSAQSHAALTTWMGEHLTLAVHAFPDGVLLHELERRVLAALDPPLNVMGMPPTELRARLTALRRRFSGSSRWTPDAVI